MAWDPTRTREENKLFLTEGEKQRIYENFAPLDPKQLKADGVFEGGGVLGIAFLGALRCCDEIGLKWCDLAGTSAGAITASLLAADYTIDELEKTMGELDYTQFLSEPVSSAVSVANSINHLAAFLMQQIKGELGQYSSEPFYKWIKEMLDRKGIQCFGDLITRNRKLKLIASDLTRAEMLVFPDSLKTPQYLEAAPLGAASYSIAKSVRMSMSIPLFFEPFRFHESIVVDGGVVSNFPLWIFDCPEGEVPDYPTFGFRLMDTNPSPQIKDPVDMVKALIRAMRYAHDQYYVQNKNQGRIVNIDLTDINTTATQFDLDDDSKDRLYVQGYLCAKLFFMNGWNWSKHLDARNTRSC